MEWRSVHLLHAADGNLPSEMAIGDDEGLAEELRLMYVALTRAKDELTVNFPLRFHVNRFATDDRHVYAQLSRFVDHEKVRPLFQEETPPAPSDGAIDLTEAVAGATVGVADEVDTMLAALWD